MMSTQQPRKERRKQPARFKITEPTVELTDETILSEISEGSRVVDLGCGDGRLLVKLKEQKGCSIVGVELGREAFSDALRNDVPVLNLDLNQSLPELPDNGFDYAVLSQTLQEVRAPKPLLSEMLRISKRIIVVVPNFGHWRVRAEIAFRGRAPVTQSLPHNWFDSPNQRFMSLHDFRDLAKVLDCRILREVPIINGSPRERVWLANLRADNVMYVLERNPEANDDATAAGF